MLGDTTIRKSFGVDPGIAAQSILLGAREKGLGGGILASIQRDALREALGIERHHGIIDKRLGDRCAHQFHRRRPHTLRNIGHFLGVG